MLPSGVYALTNTLQFNQLGIHLQGMGRSLVRLELATTITGPVVRVAAPECIIENVNILSQGNDADGGLLVEGDRCYLRGVRVTGFHGNTNQYGIKINAFNCSVYDPFIVDCERGLVIGRSHNTVFGGSIVTTQDTNSPPRSCGIEIGAPDFAPNGNSIMGLDIEMHSAHAHIFFSNGWVNQPHGDATGGKA